jgi:bacterioferritin
MTAPANALVIEKLNKILELELAGVVRYTHYSFMVFGYSRIPIVKWLREQAQESLDHAVRAGELVTHFGGQPSLGIGKLLQTQSNDIGEILRESIAHERAGLNEYKELLLIVGDSVFLDNYAREMISTEEQHIGEVDKMLRWHGPK